MKRLLLLIILTSTSVVYGQAFRLHVGGGFANYIGDIQQKRLAFNQIKGVYSFGAAYDINEQFAIRMDYSAGQVAGDDKKSNTARVIKRNLNFQTNIREISFLVEYNWKNDYTAPFIPYGFLGVASFKFSPYTFDSVGRKVYLHDLSTEGQGLSKYPTRKPYNLRQLNIPIGGGIKYNLSQGIFVALEGGIRKLFTDYLDDVSTTYVSADVLKKERGQLAVDLSYRGDEISPYNGTYPKDGSQRGNKDKDWYYFAQFRISFKLGWNDGFGGRRGRSGNKGFLRSLGCPRF